MYHTLEAGEEDEEEGPDTASGELLVLLFLLSHPQPPGGNCFAPPPLPGAVPVPGGASLGAPGAVGPGHGAPVPAGAADALQSMVQPEWGHLMGGVDHQLLLMPVCYSIQNLVP